MQPNLFSDFWRRSCNLAIDDRGERMEISLQDASSKKGLRFRLSVGVAVGEFAPAPGHLFGPLAVVLCNYAGVNYYSKGKVERKIATRNPKSEWVLNSDDLSYSVILLRTSPIPERRENHPIDWGT